MKMFIGNKQKDAHDGKVLTILNSATLEPLDTVPAAAPEDIEEAIQTAFEHKGEWAEKTVLERGRILCAAADLIEAHEEELAKSLSAEMGKIIREARGEVHCATEILRGYVEQAKHFYGDTITTEAQTGTQNDIIFTMHEPLGIVACIGPFNYPVELCMHKIASALCTGNCVILKPSSDNPLTVLRIVGLMREAGVPGYALQAVTGSGALIGDLLTGDPRINAISFTGSTEVGKHIASTASAQLKHLFLELGGNDPFIVFDDADLELAVSCAASGRLQNAGQTCCAPKRFLVQTSVAAEFTKRLKQTVEGIELLDPTDERATFGSMISPKAAATVDEQVKKTVAQGAHLVTGGHILKTSYYAPTILTGVTEDMDICGDMEVFGPVFPIIEFKSESDAVRIANATPFGLNAGVMTRDMARAMRVARKLECGSVVINASGNYRNIDQPHGGRKNTGLGREGISCTLREMTETKTYILKDIFAK